MDEQTCNGTQWTESELACISNEQIETAHGTNEPEPTDESESYDEPEFPDEAVRVKHYLQILVEPYSIRRSGNVSAPSNHPGDSHDVLKTGVGGRLG